MGLYSRGRQIHAVQSFMVIGNAGERQYTIFLKIWKRTSRVVLIRESWTWQGQAQRNKAKTGNHKPEGQGVTSLVSNWPMLLISTTHIKQRYATQYTVPLSAATFLGLRYLQFMHRLWQYNKDLHFMSARQQETSTVQYRLVQVPSTKFFWGIVRY